MVWGTPERRTKSMEQGNYAVSTLNHYLKGTNFSPHKEEVAANAEGNGAPSDLVSHIRNADTESFDCPEEVMQAVFEVSAHGRERRAVVVTAHLDQRSVAHA
jgi:hypothetical protein